MTNELKFDFFEELKGMGQEMSAKLIDRYCAELQTRTETVAAQDAKALALACHPYVVNKSKESVALSEEKEAVSRLWVKAQCLNLIPCFNGVMSGLKRNRLLG